VVLQKPQEQTDLLPPPRTLILDFTLTHTRYGIKLSPIVWVDFGENFSHEDSIPLDLSSRPFIPLTRFICQRRPLPLLAPSHNKSTRCST
jgi:hypothetical protein